MSFGSAFGKTLNDYKLNSEVIFKALFVFFFIPLLIATLVSVVWLYSVDLKPVYDEYAMVSNELGKIGWSAFGNLSNLESSSEYIGYVERQNVLSEKLMIYNLTSGLMAVIASLIAIIAFVGIIAYPYGKKMSYSDIVKLGNKNYWKVIGLGAVYVLIFFALAMLLGAVFGVISVLGAKAAAFVLLFLIGLVLFLFFIWFVVSSIFSSYILVCERKGIFESMRQSFKFTRGRWWKTFGCYVLIILLVLAFNLVLGIVYLIFNYLAEGFWFDTITGFIIAVISYFIVYPILILFFKNLYYEWKKK